jgi:hypothetical protein
LARRRNKVSDDNPPRKACCLVSEVLEQAGLDRERARKIRRQALEGIILFCQWQLERMQAEAPPARSSRRKARKVAVE